MHFKVLSLFSFWHNILINPASKEDRLIKHVAHTNYNIDVASVAES